MIISKIHISNFRNFKNKSFSFSPKITVIVGPNASGKTNIMEALFLLATGKSFKARVEEEMISYRHEIARVRGSVAGSEQLVAGKKGKNNQSTSYKLQTTNLEVVLTRGEITIGEDPEKTERVPRKRLLINGLGKRLIDFAGSFKVVLFGPQDLELVIESPSRRRNFLDTVLSQVDREYRRASLSYEKGLRQRNRLLYRIREEGLPRSQLLFWDRLLIRNGDYIGQKRVEIINFANGVGGLDDQNFSLEYDKSAISEARLEQYAEEEIAAATTLVGPHRDDFSFRLKKNRRARDLSRYGSRGEQRMAILWLKLAELAYVEQETHSTGASTELSRTSSGQAGERPTLLLDDIFSELDHEHREVVMRVVEQHQTPLRRAAGKASGDARRGSAGQAIITTADPHFVEGLREIEKITL